MGEGMLDHSSYWAIAHQGYRKYSSQPAVGTGCFLMQACSRLYQKLGKIVIFFYMLSND